ncbi:MAG: type II toxin-antitoxin system VapC family toxin [Bifidobacteriaceae bacterium]|jgi:predicted nucleic acid-binding protein|nr:type II toxin-antitoxin system VapC family toxin [Bifidobacteriaceae bacterium]
MEQLILDTSVLIDIERGLTNLRDIGDLDDDVAIAAVTVAEFAVGVERAAAPEQAAARTHALHTLMTHMRVLDYTRETAMHHARLLAAAAREGRVRGPYDIIIAAHAAETGRILVTSDRKTAMETLPAVRTRLHRPTTP